MQLMYLSQVRSFILDKVDLPSLTSWVLGDECFCDGEGKLKLGNLSALTSLSFVSVFHHFRSLQISQLPLLSVVSFTDGCFQDCVELIIDHMEKLQSVSFQSYCFAAAKKLCLKNNPCLQMVKCSLQCFSSNQGVFVLANNPVLKDIVIEDYSMIHFIVDWKSIIIPC